MAAIYRLDCQAQKGGLVMSADRPDSGRPGAMVLAGAGLELGMATVALMLGGWWLDQKLATDPWLMLTGLAIGMIGGTYNVYRLSKKYFD